MKGFGHETPYEGETNDWITPNWVIEAFDSLAGGANFFDLDPCISETQPWLTARKGYSIQQDGLKQAWWGRVWCNPPYGPHTAKWVKRLAEHGSGIALIFARVETSLWHDNIFPTASGYLFPRRRISFARPDGSYPNSSSGAPSAFVAWGDECNNALIHLVDRKKIPGAYFPSAYCESRPVIRGLFDAAPS